MRNDRIMITTNGTYPKLFVTHIFRSNKQIHGGDRKPFEAMILLYMPLQSHELTISSKMFLIHNTDIQLVDCRFSGYTLFVSCWLLNQRFLSVKLKSSLRKVYDRHPLVYIVIFIRQLIFFYSLFLLWFKGHVNNKLFVTVSAIVGSGRMKSGH
jgi:hypothetical protein